MRKFLERSISTLSIPTRAKFPAQEEEAARPQPTISAPLAGLSRTELFEQIDTFAIHYGIEEDSELLKRGALVAQNQDALEFNASASNDSLSDTSGSTPSDIKVCVRHRQLGIELTEDELDALMKDASSPWSTMTLPLALSVVVCSLGAFCQGTDQSSITGALLTFPREMGIAAVPGTATYGKNEWIIGFVSSAPFIGVCGCSAWLADPLNNFVGRRGALFLAAVITIICPLGSAFTHQWWELLICRLLLGLGIGFMEVTAPVLAAENAPTRIRGALVSSWQIYTAMGILFGSSSNLVFSEHNVGPHSWRYQIGTALVPAVPLALCVYLCPESPRWYINQSRINDAWKSLLRLRAHKIIAARDLYLLYVQLLEERAVMGHGPLISRFTELFHRNRLRQASLAAFAAMLSQPLSGISIISSYSGVVFERVTHNVTDSLWASWGFGLVNWIFSFGAIWSIESPLGRRGLLLVTFPLLFVTLLGAALSNLASDKSTKLGLVALFIYLFTAVYSLGTGPVPFSYSAEIFPLSHREVGMSMAVFWNNLVTAVLSLTFFRIEAIMTMTGAFGFYAGLNIVAWVMIFLWVPETRQLSLEELNAVFAVPTTKFMRHQVYEMVPYYVRRYIRGDKTAVAEQLAPVERFEELVPLETS